jgi:hypothetical protein
MTEITETKYKVPNRTIAYLTPRANEGSLGDDFTEG